MNCPKCSEGLHTIKIDNIELDQCNKCEGLWFEKNELKQVKDNTDSDLNWLDFEVWKKPEKFKLKSNKYTCPKCNSKMETLDYDKTNIEIDYCTSCSGIWLDKGEMEKLIENLEEELLTKSLSDYVKSTIEEAKELITGPESFISEWKDFKTILRFLQYRILSKSSKLAETISAFQKNPLNK